jgi:hypothetical protein
MILIRIFLRRLRCKKKLQEVAIMPYDSGNWMIRRALIYTVKSDRLELVKIQPNYNLEADESVFK